MELNLRYPATPEYASKHAELIVSVALEVSGERLDFTPGSLEAIDRIIEGFRKDRCQLENIAETLFAFGCYVGEVFVRNVGAVWRRTEDTALRRHAGGPLVLELGPENFCNPVGKAFKRFENGEEDSVMYFYVVFSKPRSERA